ncbi:hypothetical protein G114_16550 [Aeromonas diversa CDC 2478-85]|uniref:Lipoprotein n=1 Tax=Aeromonas diversa CDC 2478-85 TaxID=1268237 RepID=N9VGP5_9GAMM|nr:hypothetical protein [Aeromonas diversa]ENY70783.1 hypothetical protein G114_16550 [Aeromonas diversa CDC 2478-85]
MKYMKTGVLMMAAALAGCAQYEVLSVAGKDTNRWKLIQQGQGEQSTTSAIYSDGVSGIIYEHGKERSAFMVGIGNDPTCDDTMLVGEKHYAAEHMQQQKGGYNICWRLVTGQEAHAIATDMAKATSIMVNGREFDVRGFDALWKNLFRRQDRDAGAT